MCVKEWREGEEGVPYEEYDGDDYDLLEYAIFEVREGVGCGGRVWR